MVTYSELIQFGTFIVALIGLCYQIFKGKPRNVHRTFTAACMAT